MAGGGEDMKPGSEKPNLTFSGFSDGRENECGDDMIRAVVTTHALFENIPGLQVDGIVQKKQSSPRHVCV